MKRRFFLPIPLSRNHWRRIKDQGFSLLVRAGGVGVVLVIGLILAYLLIVVSPLLKPVAIEQQALPQQAFDNSVRDQNLYMAMDESLQLAVRFSPSEIAFFSLQTGQVTQRMAYPWKTTLSASKGEGASALSEGLRVKQILSLNGDKGLLFALLENGQAHILHYDFQSRYEHGQRRVRGVVDMPMASGFSQKLATDLPDLNRFTAIAIRLSGDYLWLAASDDNLVYWRRYLVEKNTLQQKQLLLVGQGQIRLHHPAWKIFLTPDLRFMLAVNQDGQASWLDLEERGRLLQHLNLSSGVPLVAMEMLAGGQSFVLADQQGVVSQWARHQVLSDSVGAESKLPVELNRLRSFATGLSHIRQLVMEPRRKGFMVLNEEGLAKFYHTTSERLLYTQSLSTPAPRRAVLSPRANGLLLEDHEGQLRFWKIDNEHPEVSWKALWQKNWYENYPQPAYVWQSSAASNDYEAKYSLTPLTFGTLKAAFYAMLFAMPLAIMGAVYTAYFMSSRQRKIIKPSIEIMEALPTVILGFLAGLWLAPLVETHLAGILSVLMLLPLAVILLSLLWRFMPFFRMERMEDGRLALILMPVLVLLIWACFHLGSVLEGLLFSGDVKLWLHQNMGLEYDQRNALIIGFAMGFAVIPTIYSITEDAIFSVPRHLVNGSLALGASVWQTLIYVVLPTASPGIFSALMIGAGRAVGETMIVLMATGNTPLMDVNLFEGMRTLAANIAIEMPESEVGSSHFRILFLSALVLFLFTFVLNTVAEVIRQHLRSKYGRL